MFAVRNKAVNFSFWVILKMSCLNSCVCKCYHTHYLSYIIPKNPTVSFTHKSGLISNSIIGEEIIEIFIATRKWAAIIQYILGNISQLAFFV